MIWNVVLIIVILELTRCSLVHDSVLQNTLYVSSYCPEMKGCVEGSHVICQYYNHHRKFGHLCKNYVKISITPEMVHQILDGVNKIRMNLAIGKETGKDGHPLPRAYGMMKMHWDSELATLAQVFADQCLGLKEDECRATEKFPNPSQFITLINFKAPNWEYLTHNSTEHGLNQEKIRSSIGKALRSLHGIKNLLTIDDINECPVLEALPNKGSRSYLKLVRGRATHIGCGISAYRRSHVMGSRSKHIYNTIQLVCNVSDGPQQSQPVYTTDPPIPGTGFTEKCGCPGGSRESKGCLCEEYSIHNTEHVRAQSKSHETEPCDDANGIGGDKPNMVMLPIFEILDAPITEPINSYELGHDAEVQSHYRLGNSSFHQASMEENEVLNEEVYPETSSELLKIPKIDNSYHEHPEGISKENREKEYKSHDHDDVVTSYERTAEHLNQVYSLEENIVQHSPREINGYDERIAVNDISNDHTDNENTFLNILDRLERAVKNVELEGRKRDIVDFKMRKIYEAALKSKGQRMKTNKHDLDKMDEIIKIADYLQHNSDSAIGDRNKEQRIKTDENKSDKIEEIKKLADFLEHKSNSAIEDKNKRQHIKQDENELDKIDEIKKIADYLQHKSDGAIDDRSTQSEKKDDLRHQGKQDNALEKIFDLLNNKQTNSNFNHKNDYHSNRHNEFKGLYENDEFTKYPLSRNQEKINRFNKNLIEYNKGKSIPDSYYSNIKNHGRIEDRKMLGNKRNIRTSNRDHAIKKKVRSRFSYPEQNLWKTRPKSLGYRRILEMENVRPTLPTTTTAPKTDRVKLKIYIKHMKRDLPNF